MYFSVLTGFAAVVVLEPAAFDGLVPVALPASVLFAEGLNFELKSVSLPFDFAVAADSAGFVVVLADGAVDVQQPCLPQRGDPNHVTHLSAAPRYARPDGSF